MLTIIIRTLRDRKTSLIVFTLAAILMMWLYIAMYPAILEQSEALTEAYANLSESMLKLFGDNGTLSFDTIEKFLALEYFNFLWPIMSIFLLVAIAGTGIAGDIENGTAQILLSSPVSRVQIFMARYFAGMIALLLFTIFSIFTVVPLATLHGVDYVFENYFSIAILSFLFGWAVFSLAMLFSAIFSEKSKVYMFTGGIIILMYVLNIASVLQEKLENLKYLSFFYYYNYNDALIRNTLDFSGIIVFIVVAVVFSIAGAMWFKKRDISV